MSTVAEWESGSTFRHAALSRFIAMQIAETGLGIALVRMSSPFVDAALNISMQKPAKTFFSPFEKICRAESIFVPAFIHN